MKGKQIYIYIDTYGRPEAFTTHKKALNFLKSENPTATYVDIINGMELYIEGGNLEHIYIKKITIK